MSPQSPSDCGEGGAGRAGLGDDLGWALATVLRTYLRAADTALRGLPGGARGYRLLSSVARDCPRSQLALSQHVGLDRTVVTYLLDDLEAAGLLARQTDPADRRNRRVVVTGAGQDRLRQLDAAVKMAERQVLGALSGTDADLLRALLQRVAARAAAADHDRMTCEGVQGLASAG